MLTAHLGYTHDAARATTTADLGFEAREGDEPIAVICGRAVSSAEDARTCAACAVVRWLEVLGDLDGLGRGSARMTLSDAHAPAAQPHRQSPAERARWRGAAQLLPAIDQHGWHDDYRPMTARAVRTRLALARSRLAFTGWSVDVVEECRIDLGDALRGGITAGRSSAARSARWANEDDEDNPFPAGTDEHREHDLYTGMVADRDD